MNIAFSDPDVLGSLICRRYRFRSRNDPLFDDVAIIIHRKSTGATCFFQMPENTGSPQDSSRVPPPHELISETPNGSPDVEQYWLSPETAERFCQQCHDSDPFIHSPYVMQTGSVPSHPWGSYKIAGKEFAEWLIVESVSVDGGNVCSSCHRIGDDFSCRSFFNYAVGSSPIKGVLSDAYRYPSSHWMPPQSPDSPKSLEEWQAKFQTDINKIKDCCQNANGEGSRAHANHRKYWLLKMDHKTLFEQEIIFYDGICGFCGLAVRIILAIDVQHRFRFAPLQGKTANILLPPSTFSRHPSSQESQWSPECPLSGYSRYCVGVRTIPLDTIWILAKTCPDTDR